MEHSPAKYNRSIFEIPVKEAQRITRAWAERDNFVRSYLIDADEIKDMISEKGASYIRVYFGWDREMEAGREQRLIMVPVDEYGNDMIDEESPADGTNENYPKQDFSNVFDFTMPCPATCPPLTSPLSYPMPLK